MNASSTGKTANGVDYITVKDVKIPIIYEKSTLPIFHLSLNFINGGISNSEKIGVANMSAEILNEGTKKLGNEKFAALLEDKAINIGAGVGIYSLKFNLDSLKEYKNDGLGLLKNLLSDPNLKPQTLNKLKVLAQANLLASKNNFDFVASKNLKTLQFKGTKLETTGYGNEANLNKITLKDVEKHIKNSLNLSNLIVVSGGDFELDEIKKDLENLLNNLPKGEKQEVTPIQVRSNIAKKVVKKNTKQAYIYFGSPFVLNNFEEESHLAKVASFILGGSGFGSRLMEEVRVKRGLVYSAYHTINADKYISFASGYLQTKLDNSAEALELVKVIIKDFVENGVTQKELEGATAFLIGSQPLKEETLSQRLDARFNNYFRGLDMDFNKQEIEKLKNLDLKTLNQYIKNHKELMDLSISIVEK